MTPPVTMTRSEKVAVVELFLECMARSELDALPVAPALTVQSPLIPKLGGKPAMDYIGIVAASTTSVRVVQHIVEGDYVVTSSENETASGPVWIFARFRLESARIQDVRVFYDNRQIIDTPDGDS